MKVSLIIIYALFGLLPYCKSQFSVDKKYSAVNWDDGDQLVELPGGDFMLGVIRYNDFMLYRVNNKGDTIWTKKYAKICNFLSKVGSLQLTKDGNLIVTVSTQSPYDIYVAKISTDGDLIWEKTYGGVNSEYSVKMIELSDNNYLMVCDSYSFDPKGKSCIVMVKYGTDGVVLWEKKFLQSESPYGIEAEDVIEAPNGDIIVTGSQYGTQTFSLDYGLFVLKTNKDGNELLRKVYTINNKALMGRAIISFQNGQFGLFVDYNFGGNVSVPSFAYYALDTDLNIKLNAEYKGPSYSNGVGFYSYTKLRNGNIVINSVPNLMNAWVNHLILINPSGLILNEKGLSHNYRYRFYNSLIETKDGNLALIGIMDNYQIDYDICFAITDQSFCFVSPYIHITSDRSLICDNNPVELTATSDVQPLTWSNGVVGNSIKVTAQGDYFASSSNSVCVIKSNVVTLKKLILPQIVQKEPVYLCKNDSSLLNISDNQIGQWSTGITANKIYAHQPGQYKAIITNECGSFETNEVRVTLPEIEITSDKSLICNNSSSVQLTAKSDLKPITWSNGTVGNTITVTSPGNYFAKATLPRCTIKSDTLSLKRFNMPRILQTSPVNICPNDTAILELSDNLTGFWNNGDISDKIYVHKEGDYKTTVTNDCGSFETNVVEVKMNPYPEVELGSDTTMFNNLELKLNAGNQDFSYLWSTGDITPSIIVNHPGTYAVKVTNFCGSASDAIKVDYLEAPEIEIPDVITPNGDGHNDEWIIKNAENYPQVAVQIWDVWGKVVFKTNYYTTPWEGKYNENLLPNGSYFYVIEIPSAKKKYKGALTIYH